MWHPPKLSKVLALSLRALISISKPSHYQKLNTADSEMLITEAVYLLIHPLKVLPSSLQSLIINANFSPLCWRLNEKPDYKQQSPKCSLQCNQYGPRLWEPPQLSQEPESEEWAPGQTLHLANAIRSNAKIVSSPRRSSL